MRDISLLRVGQEAWAHITGMIIAAFLSPGADGAVRLLKEVGSHLLKASQHSLPRMLFSVMFSRCTLAHQLHRQCTPFLSLDFFDIILLMPTFAAYWLVTLSRETSWLKTYKTTYLHNLCIFKSGYLFICYLFDNNRLCISYFDTVALKYIFLRKLIKGQKRCRFSLPTCLTICFTPNLSKYWFIVVKKIKNNNTISKGQFPWWGLPDL